MSRDAITLLVAIIGALGAGGIGSALVSYAKDRKKDASIAKLTDVEALQKQLVLLTQITEFLRKENDQLHKDYELSEEQRRKMRVEMERLQEDLQRVKLGAARTQDQCDVLSQRVRELLAEGDE